MLKQLPAMKRAIQSPDEKMFDSLIMQSHFPPGSLLTSHLNH